jgi:hypothetical protein
MSGWFNAHFAGEEVAPSSMDLQVQAMEEEEWAEEASLLRRRREALAARAVVVEAISVHRVAVAAAEADWAALQAIVAGEDEEDEAEEVAGEDEEDEADEAEEDEGLPDWGETDEEWAYHVHPAVAAKKVKGKAKAKAVAAGTWVGRPRHRRRKVIRSGHKRAGTWLGRGPSGKPSSSTGPNVNVPSSEDLGSGAPGGASSSAGPG